MTTTDILFQLRLHIFYTVYRAGSSHTARDGHKTYRGRGLSGGFPSSSSVAVVRREHCCRSAAEAVSAILHVFSPVQKQNKGRINYNGLHTIVVFAAIPTIELYKKLNVIMCSVLQLHLVTLQTDRPPLSCIDVTVLSVREV